MKVGTESTNGYKITNQENKVINIQFEIVLNLILKVYVVEN